MGRKPKTAIDLSAVFASVSKEKETKETKKQTKKSEASNVSLSPVHSASVSSSLSERQDKEYKSRFPSSKKPALLDKYEDDEGGILHSSNAIRTDGFASSREKIYIVQDYKDGFVAGITKSWDTAWDILKMRLFNDHGEFTDKDVAFARMQEKGYVLLKSSIGNLHCIIKQMKIEE